MPSVTFTPDKLRHLKAAYKKAVAQGAESFVFDGSEYMTAYAKYLIEYLDTVFGRRGPAGKVGRRGRHRRR